jgi:alpha-L-fucosidase
MFNSAIQGFEIQYKKGNQWITWAKDTKMGNWEKELTPVKARYFRLVILDRDYMSGIKEFQLFPPSK